jgi:hypothetical protein
MKFLASPGSYSFNAAAKTLTFTAQIPARHGLILSVARARGGLLYQPQDANYGGTWSSPTLTFAQDTAGYSNGDDLEVWLDDGATSTSVSDGGGSLTVDGSVSIVGTVPVSGSVTVTNSSLEISNDAGNPVPVSGTFWQTTQPVSLTSSPLPSGASTSALQTAGNVSLGSIDGKLPTLISGRVPVDIGSSISIGSSIEISNDVGNPIPVSGTVAISNSSVEIANDVGNPIPVSGTFFQATQPISAASLPLPSGAATSVNQTTANTSLSSIDGKLPALVSGRLPVDTGASGGLTDAQLRAAPVPVTGGLTDSQLRATPVSASASSLPLPTGAATSANQATSNSSLSSIDGKLTGVATDATLAQVRDAIKAQIDVAATLWTDNSGAYYVRRDLVNEGTGVITVTFTDPSGASATPGAGLRPLSTTDRDITQTLFDATAGGTGYSSGDILARILVIDVNATPVVTSAIWVNLTSGAVISTPTGGTYERADETIGARQVGTWSVSGPLTDTQLRASAVPVSGPLTDAQIRASALATTALTDTQLRASAVPVSGAFFQATQPISAAALPLPSGAATETTLSALNAKTPSSPATENGNLASILGRLPANLTVTSTRLLVDGSGVTQPVSGTFWQATQPISAAALPLPSGAATSANQTTANTSLGSIDGKLPSLVSGRIPVDTGSSGGLTDTQLRATPVPVSGTFFQTTQPISAASLPLPSGAASAANQAIISTTLGTLALESGGNLASILGRLPANLTVSSTRLLVDTIGTVTANAGTNLNTSALALESGGNLATLVSRIPAQGAASASASTPIAISVETATGNITTQNLVTNGNATAGSAVEIGLLGHGVVAIQVTGTYTGALSVQLTNDGSRWETVTAAHIVNAITGVGTATIASATVGIFRFGAAGFFRLRVTGLAAMTGTASVTLRAAQHPYSVTAIQPTAGNLNVTAAGTGTFAATQSGTWTVQPGNTANTTPWLIAPAVRTPTTTSVASSASSVTILASNANRRGMTVANDSTSVLRLSFSTPATAANSFVVMQPNTFLVLDPLLVSTGTIYGIWASANGTAQVTEWT